MTSQAADAASILWQNWQRRTRIDELPVDAMPADRAAAYATQRDIVLRTGEPIVGWKIAATSAAGQKHIGVDGPLAGPLVGSIVFADGATIPLDGNIMRVAEAEFAFKFAKALPRRDGPYTQAEVFDAVGSLHTAIEVPDSRYNDFAKVGANQLIADTACSCWFILGPATKADWRARDLAAHQVTTYVNEAKAGSGSGANVLGDPRIALTWLVNELNTYASGIEAGQFVTTGACVPPTPIKPGDRFRADFGDLGAAEAHIS
jgi:2-keto-4-pentenoate hydratase